MYSCQTCTLQCERLYAAKCGIILFQFPVLLIRNGLTPFVGVLFARNFDGEMGEPGIRSGTVPVFDFRRNIDAVARLHLDGFFAFLLIVAASGHAYKDLSAAALCVVDMPVVAAAGFEGHIEHTDLFGGYRCEIALTDEVFCEGVIRGADREDHGLCMGSHGLVLVRKIAFIHLPYFFCKVEDGPALRPADVECHMGDDRSDLFAYPTDVKNVYPKEAFTAENAAKIPCEQVLGTYWVVFER